MLFYCVKCWAFAEHSAKRLAKPCARPGEAALSERDVKNRRAITRGRHPDGGWPLQHSWKVETGAAIQGQLRPREETWRPTRRLRRKTAGQPLCA